jgi:DNA-binding response OmpR family regulator
MTLGPAMRHPMLIIVEGDGRLAGVLRPAAEQHKWAVYEPRQANSILRLLRRGGPAVVVIKAGRDLERELALLERTARLCPEAATVLVGDVDHPALAGLAWDLGADCVVFPPQARELLTDIVTGLMKPNGERQSG